MRIIRSVEASGVARVTQGKALPLLTGHSNRFPSLQIPVSPNPFRLSQPTMFAILAPDLAPAFGSTVLEREHSSILAARSPGAATLPPQEMLKRPSLFPELVIYRA